MSRKLNILLEQRTDLSTANDLLTDIENGHKFMKVYKQMKMYNDDELNPILYQNKSNMQAFFFIRTFFFKIIYLWPS
jgi:hypothetical protein